MREWAANSILGSPSLESAEAVRMPGRGLAETIPFSFKYGGQSSALLLAHWKREVTALPPADGRERHTVTWTDERSGLQVACEITLFSDFPAVEWLLRLRNMGDKDSAILENIRPLDLGIGVGEKETVVFHHAKGSTYEAWRFNPRDDFAAIDTVLASGEQLTLPSAGAVSQTCLPYFNLEWQGGGLAGALGWTGQWELSVQRPDDRKLVLQAGQQLTHLKLLPGESIRTPRVLLVQWRGDDRFRGHNLLRRLLLAHYVPRANGQVITPLLTQNMFEVFKGNGTTEQNQLEAIPRMPAMGLEGYWLDAGWFEGGWWQGAGSWYARKDHFPNGLRPLGDAAHRAGLKFVLWFEPERVNAASRIAKEHPEFVLGLNSDTIGIRVFKGDGLFNLGDPSARAWMTDLLSQRITEWGVDIYRHDRNLYPYRFWRANDAPDRQGISEIRHIEGLYAMWDELLKRHPGLIIDNSNWRCTGPDLEVLMRSAGSWTSCEAAQGGRDRTYDQAQLAGLSLYLPLHAGQLYGTDPYTVRSIARLGTSLSYDTRPASFSAAEMKRASQEILELRPLYLGDYHPLTEIGLDDGHWCAWQFDRPDLGRGFAMCFRRPASPYPTCELALKGLNPADTYEVSFAESYDVKEKRTMTGAQLARLVVGIGSAPGSLLIRYTRLGR